LWQSAPCTGFGLIIFYALGVTFRKNLVAHATFMLAAALTILGPAGDQLIGNICDAMGLPFNAIARRKRQRTNPKFYFFDNGVQRALAEELNIDLAPRMPLKRSDTKNN
jgi:hypothetical protein